MAFIVHATAASDLNNRFVPVFFSPVLEEWEEKRKWLATLTAEPWGLGSNPGEDMDGCKCIKPSLHRGNLNSRRAVSPLVKLVEGEERWEASELPKMFSL
ncbi:uncharacterized protein TNCV_3472811 [Trichonephila clavipes]|nr:uncharacterized protein TNCV_3472811 [Trichonephila clavipes]